MHIDRPVSEFPIGRAAILAGLLAFGSQNLVPNPVETEKNTAKPDKVTLDSPNTDYGQPDFGELIRAVLTSELTPKEEAAICQEILNDVQEINPLEDPAGYMQESKAYEDCRADLSLVARTFLYDADSQYYTVREHLMRCTPRGEEFSLEQLEKCEDVEEQWVEKLSDELALRDIELVPKYRDEFNFLPEQGLWEEPGYYFEVDRFDAMESATYNFRVDFHGETHFIIAPIYSNYDPTDDTVYDYAFIQGGNVGIVGGDFMREYEEMTRGPQARESEE